MNKTLYLPDTKEGRDVWRKAELLSENMKEKDDSGCGCKKGKSISRLFASLVNKAHFEMFGA